MKKLGIVLLALLLLSGCGKQTVFEKVEDLLEEPYVEARRVSARLPKDAAVPVSGQDGGALYVCDGYSVTIQTLEGGDLDQTLRTVTGFPREKLQLLEQTQGEVKRYDCAWSCAGEGGDLVCQGVVLDDGCYHYVLTVMMEAGRAKEVRQEVNALCASFQAA